MHYFLLGRHWLFVEVVPCVPKCRNQIQEPICFTCDAQFGWGLFPLRQGDGCGQLDRMDLEKT